MYKNLHDRFAVTEAFKHGQGFKRNYNLFFAAKMAEFLLNIYTKEEFNIDHRGVAVLTDTDNNDLGDYYAYSLRSQTKLQTKE